MEKVLQAGADMSFNIDDEMQIEELEARLEMICVNGQCSCTNLWGGQLC